MKFSEHANQRILFYDSLFATLKQKKALFFCLFFAVLLVGIIDSVFNPQYLSETMILYNFNPNPTAAFSFNTIQTANEEKQISTQLSILNSFVIMKQTLSSFFETKNISSKDIIKLKNSLKFKRQPLSNLLLIQLKWPKKDETQGILNKFVSIYNSWYNKNQNEEAIVLDEFLKKEIETKKNELEESENKLKQFLDNTDFSSFDEYYNELVVQFAKDEIALYSEKMKLNILQKKNERILELLSTEEKSVPASSNLTATLISMENFLQKEKIHLLELQKRYTDNSIEVQDQKKKIRFLEDELKTRINDSLSDNMETSIDMIKQMKEKLMDNKLAIIESSTVVEHLTTENENHKAQLKKLNKLRIENSRLERLVEIKKASYMQLNQKREDNLSFVSKNDRRHIQILYPPIIPKKSNTLTKNLLYSIVVFIILTVFITVLSIYYSINFQNQHILAFTTQKSVLGNIPPSQSNQSFPVDYENINLHFFESFRKLATKISFMDPAPSVIQVLSIYKNSGKSLISANLATALSQSKAKVLLIDCDHKKQTAYQFFSETKIPSQIESDIFSWNKYLKNSRFPNLDITMIKFFISTPLEILNTGYFEKFLNDVKSKYDFIILDSLSVYDHTYPSVLSKFTNLNLGVIRLHNDKKSDVIKAAHLLDSICHNTLQWVVNHHIN